MSIESYPCVGGPYDGQTHVVGSSGRFTVAAFDDDAPRHVGEYVLDGDVFRWHPFEIALRGGAASR